MFLKDIFIIVLGILLLVWQALFDVVVWLSRDILRSFHHSPPKK